MIDREKRNTLWQRQNQGGHFDTERRFRWVKKGRLKYKKV